MNEDDVSLDNRFTKSDKIIFRRISGEAVLVPLHTWGADMDCIYSLNETASSAWVLLDGIRTLRQVADEIVAEFDVSLDMALDDVLGLVKELITLSAVEKV